MTFTKKTTIALLGAGLTGAIVWVLTSEGQRQDTPPVVEPAQIENASAANASPEPTKPWEEIAHESARSCVFEAGQRMAYTIEHREEIAWRSALLPSTSDRMGPDEARAQVKTRGHLEVRALEASPDRALMLARFVAFETSRIQRDGEVRRPFLFQIDGRCQIQGFAHLDETPAPYARIQQAVLHELLWRLPEQSGERFEGSDDLGAYVASLSAFERDGVVRITRETHEIEAWPEEPHGLETVDRAGLRVFRADASPWFDRATMSATLTGEGLRMERSMSARSVTPRPRAFDGVPTDSARYVWTDLLPFRLDADEPRPRTKDELRALAAARKLTTNEAVDAYVERVESDLGLQKTWPKLTTYLEARPDQAEAVIEKLYRGELPAEATMGVYIALGQTRTPQARQALEGLMRDEGVPVFDRSRAMFALGGRADVGLEFARYMSQQAERLDDAHRSERFLAGQSLLALGYMADQQDDDDEVRRESVHTISQALTRPVPHDRAKSSAFGAVANLGDASLLDLVQEYTDHPDWRVRRDLAIVTRRMPPEESAAFTAAWLDKETSPMVRANIYRTLDLQTYDAQRTTSEQVLRHALADLEARPDLGLRLPIITVLGQALEFSQGEDELGIENALASLIPYELEMRTGLYDVLAKQIDPRRVRAVLSAYRQEQRAARDRGQKVDIDSWRFNPPTSPFQGAPTAGRPQ